MSGSEAEKQEKRRATTVWGLRVPFSASSMCNTIMPSAPFRPRSQVWALCLISGSNNITP